MSTYYLNSGVPEALSAGDIVDCLYCGAITSISLPKGKYKLEVWGAQGGPYSGAYGGNGGYSVGTLELQELTEVFVAVGQRPSGNAAAFNGGGQTNSYGGAGGGGSDIRIGQNSLYARVIVAGGGGGHGYSSTVGGYGGGTNGGSGGNGSVTGGYGGSQTGGGANNTIGVFGRAQANGSNGGGGGGGWYGGASGTGGGTDSGGGGGSGYVYTAATVSSYPSGCLLNPAYYLSDAQTIAGNLSFPRPSGGNETGHADNGYARITVIEISSADFGMVQIDDEWKTIDGMWVQMREEWKEVDSLYVQIGGTWVSQ